MDSLPQHESPAIDAGELRACLRDLISLLALPALWSGRDRAGMLTTLLDVLVGVLRVDIAYAALERVGASERIEAARTLRRDIAPPPLEELREHFAAVHPQAGLAAAVELGNPFGGGALRAVALPLGLEGEGILVVASAQPRFPRETDMVLLRVAANNAGFGARSALLLEQRTRAEEEARARLEEARAAQRELELAYRVAATVDAAGSLEQVVVAGLDAMTSVTGTPHVALLLADCAGAWSVAGCRGFPDECGPWLAATYSSREGTGFDDVDAFAVREPSVDALGRAGIRALAAVSLRSADRRLGTFVVGFADVLPHDWSIPQIAETIATHVAQGIGRQQAERERDRVIGELQATLKLNEMFAGILAHDLRNPLAAIVMGAQIVLQRDDSDNVARPLRRILSSSERMRRMIEQLLDFTRLRVGGGIELRARATDLVELCSQVIDELEYSNPEWSLELRHEGVTTGQWDPDRLQQVLSNLAGNAVQHGHRDGGVSVLVDGRRADRVDVIVHNHGAIAPALLPTLFEPFRGSAQRDAGARGLGLGLFIGRQLARAHGGDMFVESSEADGTRFTLQLPRKSHQ